MIAADDTRKKFVLRAGTKVCDFVMSNRAVDIILGPIGSGKTQGLCARVMRHVQQQGISPIDGLRRSRWAVVRNTLPELKRTTIRTWLDMFPEHLHGRFIFGAVLQHRLKFGDILCDVDFLSLDKVEDVRKLRSAEYTGIAFNELPFMERELFTEARSRLRFPGPEHGGATWRGVIADGNAPDEDHWLAPMTGLIDPPPGLTEEEQAALVWPDDWGLYIQPPALIEQFDEFGRLSGYTVNPEAENIENLPKDYYQKMIAGNSKAWIDSRLMVRCALVVEGSPVWPMFRREAHVAREPLRPVGGHKVTVGLDFGRQPAATFMQSINNRVQVQFELAGFNEGSVTFAPKVRRFLAAHYPDHLLAQINFFGDPKGQDKGQADERTSYEIFEANGMKVRPPPGLKQNMISTRVDTVSHLLNEMYDGRARFVVSPLCRTLIVGMAGRYHLVKEEDGELRPKKDRYADMCDSLQYGCIGLGEARTMVGLRALSEMKPVMAYRGRKSMRRVSA